MFKLLVVLVALALVVGQSVAKPQLLVDTYGYYPGYVAAYSAPLTYSYPYAYAYSYPLAYY